MSKIRFFGDIHGHFPHYKLLTTVDTDYYDQSVQVGDFAIGMGQSNYWHRSVNEFHADGRHKFIRGNHDNPTVCKTQMIGYIPDGHIDEHGIMYIGGAWSIDYRYRTPGVDWWEDEELSEEEFEVILEKYKTEKPDFVVTHDCPSIVSKQMFVDTGLTMFTGVHIQTRTGEYLQQMLDFHQPKEWIFGHWHHTMSVKFGDTMFSCVGELDYMDIEV